HTVDVILYRDVTGIHTCAHPIYGGDPVFDGRASGAAVAFQVHAEQAEVAHDPEDLGREDRVLIPVGDIGADLSVHEGTDALADLEFGLREESWEVEQIGWVGGG